MDHSAYTLFHWWMSVPWNRWLDNANKLTQILVAAGGGFAAFRKFGVKADLSIVGTSFESSGVKYIAIAAAMKNSGAVKLHLTQRGTAVIISALESAPLISAPQDGPPNLSPQVRWNTVAVFSVFEPHTWIEPTGTIEDIMLIKAPPDTVAVRLHIRVVARFLRQMIEWNSASIVKLPEVSSINKPDIA